jgi:hypothetical protein
MSSVINNSNANSAIVQTLDASVSKRNPQIYSTKEIYPAHSMTYVKNEFTNGTATDGNSINFNLNKYGIASQILLHLEKISVLANGNESAGGTGQGAKLARGDIFDIIKSVELLSSSRVISTLTSNDLLAQFSDMSQEEYNVVFQKAIDIVGDDTTTRYVFVLPLVFGLFKDINTQPNLSFVEPMSIRVNFGKTNHYAALGTGAAPPTGVKLDASKCYLQIRYKAYPEASVAEVIDQNYSEPELNQLSQRFYDENVTSTGAMTQGQVKSFFVDLKNTDAVTDFYVIVREVDIAGNVRTDAQLAPFGVESVKFTGSGQDILDLTSDELAYVRLGVDGNALAPIGASTSTYGINNVVKLQTGIWHRNAMTNCFSLREINAPRITISFKAPSAGSFEVVVVEDCLAIYSTSSATGRQVLSLTN